MIRTVSSVERLGDARRLLRIGAPEYADWGIQYGSSRKFQADCVNIDRLTLVAADGRHRTDPGELSRIDGTHLYLQWDLRHSLPLPSDFAPWVFAEHFVEHLEQREAIAWLRETRRILQPHGVARITTPDLRRFLEGYVKRDGFLERHAERLAVPEAAAAAKEYGEPADRPAFVVNQIFYWWGHRWIYDFDELVFIALEAGFLRENIRERGFRDSSLPRLGQIDMERRREETLYVELIKEEAPSLG